MILKQLNLSVKQGSFVCVIGDVGSGKSSLLNCLTNNMLHTEGSFFKQYCHETIEEIKSDLLENSKKKFSTQRAPVVISDSVSLV